MSSESDRFASDRLCDLMKQGFMKPRKPRKPKKKPEIVACTRCLNWHLKGKHTVPRTRKKTYQELVDENDQLRAYQEAFWCLLRGEKPVEIRSDEFSTLLLGAHRASGGVVLFDSQVLWAERWAGSVTTADPYKQEVARKVVRAIAEGAMSPRQK